MPSPHLAPSTPPPHFSHQLITRLLWQDFGLAPAREYASIIPAIIAHAIHDAGLDISAETVGAVVWEMWPRWSIRFCEVDPHTPFDPTPLKRPERADLRRQDAHRRAAQIRQLLAQGDL